MARRTRVSKRRKRSRRTKVARRSRSRRSKVGRRSKGGSEDDEGVPTELERSRRARMLANAAFVESIKRSAEEKEKENEKNSKWYDWLWTPEERANWRAEREAAQLAAKW